MVYFIPNTATHLLCRSVPTDHNHEWKRLCTSFFPVAPCTVPSLSGMKMPVTEMIQETINRLLSMLDGGELSKRLKPDRARVGGGGAILGW
ncbi:hypothetical protein JMX68_29130 (plasmid) [Klebsiella pneumoniae]|nr:hypothetical protein [Klebsiella pneumoniae]UZJ12117.1 hypothetical protein JMX68_29130 [Klebsiella pneumoniae]UZJ18031.1 hypothetical protein JMX78_30550 [Klebsiella pneumoniae]UZL03835.1 hypothetical protein JMX65_01050 [Klebsiella pneumoniae]